MPNPSASLQEHRCCSTRRYIYKSYWKPKRLKKDVKSTLLWFLFVCIFRRPAHPARLHVRVQKFRAVAFHTGQRMYWVRVSGIYPECVKWPAQKPAKNGVESLGKNIS